MEPILLRGKSIGTRELDVIRQITEERYLRGRTFISVGVCQSLNWLQPNGNPQDVACREILRRLESLGLVHLPTAKTLTPNQIRAMSPCPQSAWDKELPFVQEKLEGSLGDFPAVRLTPIEGRSQAKLWANLMVRYHYLGYRWSVGRSLKYFIHLGSTLAGAMGWGSASWKLAPRDSLIGWDPATRQRNLKGIAGNNRFLILPWIKVKNLASHVLGLASKEVPKDWHRLYGVSLYLLESFVDPNRFKGTCYKAANWIYLGQSKGSSKSGNSYLFHGQIKDVYILALTRDFREKLCRS